MYEPLPASELDASLVAEALGVELDDLAPYLLNPNVSEGSYLSTQKTAQRCHKQGVHAGDTPAICDFSGVTRGLSA